jgi:hypothetical protein
MEDAEEERCIRMAGQCGEDIAPFLHELFAVSKKEAATASQARIRPSSIVMASALRRAEISSPHSIAEKNCLSHSSRMGTGLVAMMPCAEWVCGERTIAVADVFGAAGEED